MSPRQSPGYLAIDSFPRVSGDEPAASLLERLAGSFSPRERG